jgi:S-adenosylmethionine decarboxylase
MRAQLYANPSGRAVRFNVAKIRSDATICASRESDFVVGNETIVDAFGCEASALRDLPRLQMLLDAVMRDLRLKHVAEPLWHVFGGEAGVTGIVLLTESHLACHTYPEFGLATFNLYSCSEKPQWDWERQLAETLGAREVIVRCVPRGARSTAAAAAGVE